MGLGGLPPRSAAMLCSATQSTSAAKKHAPAIILPITKTAARGKPDSPPSAPPTDRLGASPRSPGSTWASSKLQSRSKEVQDTSGWSGLGCREQGCGTGTDGRPLG